MMAMWKRRASGMALALALLGLLTGCAFPTLPWQTSGPAFLPDAQQILRISAPNLSGGRIALDPTGGMSYTFGGALLLSLTYSGLLTFDSGLRPIPALADHYTVSADGLRYTFHPRSGARFSDGAPITAADAAFSLDRAAGPCASATSYFFSALKDQPRYAQQNCQPNPHGPPTITAVGQPLVRTLVGDALLTPDPSTLVIVLAHPDGALPVKLAEPAIGIVERAVVTRYGGEWPSHISGGQGTSGMYALKSIAPGGSYDTLVTLIRAKDYWGERPQLREVVIDLRASQGTPTGDVIFAGDTRGNSPNAQAAQQYIRQTLSKQPGFHQAPTRAEDYLLLDPKTAGLTDVRVRQALALALDKPAIAALLGGVATNHLIPPGAGAYPTALSGPVASAPLTGDPAAARALWQSYVHDRCGGVASRCPQVTLWGIVYDLSGTDPFTQALDEAIARQWRAALPGLRVRIVPVYFGPIPDVTQALRTTSDYLWLEDYPDPQDWLSVFASPPGSSVSPPNDFTPTIGALVQRAEAALDPTTRLDLYHQAELTLLNDAVVVPLAQQELAWSVKPRVSGFPDNPAPAIPPSVWVRIALT